jgi:hypothetical protein
MREDCQSALKTPLYLGKGDDRLYMYVIHIAVLWTHIRIGSVFSGVPGSGSRRAKITHKK